MEHLAKRWNHPIHWAIPVGLILITVMLGGTWAKSRWDPERLEKEAELALNSNNAEAAEASLKWLRQVREPTAADLMLEAKVALALADPDRAISALNSIPTNDPIGPQALLLAGQAERERKRVRHAERYLKRSLELDPQLLQAHRELLYIYGMQSRRTEIDAEFRSIAKLTVLNHHDLFTWAFTQFSPHRLDDAPFLNEFIQADPDDRESRVALAEILISSGGSREELEKVLSGLSSTEPEVLAIRVRLAMIDGDLAKAKELLAADTSNHPQLERIRGQLAVRDREYARAVECFRRVHATFPFDRTATIELGQALSLAGDPGAEQVVEQSKRLDEVYNLVNRIKSADHENSAPEIKIIARAFEKAGLNEQAFRWFELAVSRDPFDADAQRGLRHTRDASQ